MRLARGQLVGLGVAVASGLVYGVAIVTARMSYDHDANFLLIVACRYTLLCLLLWFWLVLRSESYRLPPHVRWSSLGTGVLSVATTAAYLGSVVYIPVSLATLIFYTNPLVTLFLAALFLRDRTGPIELAATVVAMFGVAVVLQVSFESLSPLGLLLGGLGSIAAAIVFVLSSRIMREVDAVRFTFHLALGGAVLVDAIACLPGMLRLPESALGWGLVAITTLTNVTGLIGMFVSVRLLGPVPTPMVLNLEPVTAVVLAIWLLNERLTAIQLMGVGLVIIAILAAQAARARPRKATV
jgi:drug/metabolite transporter (DMT)-like permease